MPFNVNNTTVVTDDRIVQSVSGAVGARPATPVTGMMFFNTTDSIMEVYDGTAWISTTVGSGDTPNAWAWGGNDTGRLGDNSVTSRSSPVSVVGGITDWIFLEARASHSIGIRANGTMWSWGTNLVGELGNNSTVSRSSPGSVVGGFTDWISASTGTGYRSQSIGLRANGTLWGWGRNDIGQLGNNLGPGDISSPTIVAGGITDWVSSSTGNAHCLGLRANGTMYAWGLDLQGSLGINVDGEARSSPTLVVGGITDWTSASCGATHSLGVRGNGTLYAWGNNTYGKLGANIAPATSRSSPVLVAGGITDWLSASAGSYHSIGLRGNGTMYAWGSNSDGQLGNNLGATASRSSPTLVAGGFTDWIDVAAASVTSLGIRG